VHVCLDGGHGVYVITETLSGRRWRLVGRQQSHDLLVDPAESCPIEI
jgi:hypothetical protein